MEEKMLKIIVADDHGIVRSGLNFLIEQQKDMQVIAEADSFFSLTEVLKTEDCDLLILDLNLGDKNGFQSIKEVHKVYEGIPILVLSMYPEEMYALQSIKAGAVGYLNKKVITEELVMAIQTIAKGEIYLSKAVNDTLLYGEELQEERKNPSEILSKREFEVLIMIAKGMNYKEIAEKLMLSPKTVSTYRTRVLEKLSLENTNQLIHYALQNDIVV
jgi:DNA-binding NarL/FixJ family response regulator